MRALLTALTCLMLFATPVVAGDWEDGKAKFTRSVPINSWAELSQLVESIGR